MQPLSCLEITVSPGVELYHIGPSLDHGPLPSFFYFALSGPDSLCLDPFNQPVQFLLPYQVRIFSLTLPAHESPFSPNDAMGIWAKEIGSGINYLDPFLDQMDACVDFVLQQKLAIPEKLAVGGLSRGSFIAAHCAARKKELKTLLGFAPATCLRWIKEFSKNKSSELADRLDLMHLKDQLFSKQIRFYMGNRDHRVNTRSCFDLIETLADTAYQNRISSPPIELQIYPSIGYLGHGTPPGIFKDGVEWLIQSMGAS